MFFLKFVNSREWFLQYDFLDPYLIFSNIFSLKPSRLPLLTFPYSPSPPAFGSTFFLSFSQSLDGINPHILLMEK